MEKLSEDMVLEASIEVEARALSREEVADEIVDELNEIDRIKEEIGKLTREFNEADSEEERQEIEVTMYETKEFLAFMQEAVESNVKEEGDIFVTPIGESE